MLFKSLSLKNFKCFEEVDVKFAPITLLTGANSSGKSSLINSLLAMFQTEQFPFNLSPNGDYVNMGSFEKMVYQNDLTKDISLDLEIENQSVSGIDPHPVLKTKWKYNSINDLPKLNSIDCRFEELYFVNTFWDLKLNTISDSSLKFNLDLRMDDIRNDEIRSWLEDIEGFKGSFEKRRNGHDNHIRITKSFSSINGLLSAVRDRKFIFNESFNRQFDGSLFNYIGSFRRPPERSNVRKSKALNRIETDGEGYLDQIIEWKETNTEKFDELNKIITELELLESVGSFTKDGTFEISVKVKKNSNEANLADVGFGVSQFLPIIVADLQLPDNSCLAISQPEIHLHPKIQASLGDHLQNQIRSKNKQYIIETHSEYLLNRIRLLLVKGDLKPQDVKVYYFENDGIKSTVHDIEFATDGQIKNAPDGFFDTYGIDVMNIALNLFKE
ncbi:DUF3696 domain-containing protein [Dyadobacter frigoris]|uniref:DUF3696 domain-containing protein n=1 Tax=Dyadobacter frigoris TaxID=2576211 RepID=A0A4U6DC66_9BACT|nr:DUF3696 domain-containing protein [Dyadobacter frigoris]TKT94081.1 DUF3696 domain-containing protein [Dyadobacter frigoris]